MKPYVIYWNNIPAPYMVERFNSVAQRGNLEFEAWFSSRTKSDRSWTVDESSWNFRYQWLPHLGGQKSPVILPSPLLTRRAPDLWVSLYGNATFVLGWMIARTRASRTAFWSEVTFDAWVRRRVWKERLKSAIFPRADAILTAGKDGATFAHRYGAVAERVFEVPHVVDFEYYAGKSMLTEAARARVRQELGIHGTCFIYVGRLWFGKGLRYLLEAFAQVKDQTAGDVTLLLVGDGVDEVALRDECQARNLDRVIFAGFHQADTLPHYYAASDVFVFPTLGDPFGMVVLEAMACGLPVIATTASGEIGERVVDGVNGFLVPPADSELLRERMVLLARDPEVRRRMGSASVQKVSGQAPEMWAAAFEQAVEQILAMPPVRDGLPARALRLRGSIGSRVR
jgi:glycosyltransferase involved in cell wall biosynthesis